VILFTRIIISLRTKEKIRLKNPRLLENAKQNIRRFHLNTGLGHAQLPFQCFKPNAAWYSMMLVGQCMLEFFKQDVSAPVLSVGTYASIVAKADHQRFFTSAA
jgi:hypothetical protein